MFIRDVVIFFFVVEIADGKSKAQFKNFDDF